MKLKNAYKEEESKIAARLEEVQDIKEFIDLGLVDEDGIIKNEQYVFPKIFADYLNTFIDKELSI